MEDQGVKAALLDLGNGLEFDLEYLSTEVRLTVVPSP